MLTTGIFTTHRFEIPCRMNQTIELIPFGDVHRSSPAHSKDHWNEFLEYGRNSTNAYFLGVGDYNDLASSSERAQLLNGKFHDATVYNMESMYKQQTKVLTDEIEFMRGRLIGLLGGNHYAQYQDGTTSDMKMCDTLCTKYLGCSAFIKLVLRLEDRPGQTRSIYIWAHHGKGAARLVGGSLNRVEQMREAAEADIYIMGHDHKKAAAPTVKLKLVESKGNLVVRHKKQLLIRSGSFLRGYVDGEASYVADAAMNPLDLGFVVIKITVRRKEANGIDDTYVDLHASV